MSLVIAVDFDGVMYPFPFAMATWWAETGLMPELPVEPICREWWTTIGVSDAEWLDALTAFGEADGYRMAAPYADAAVGVVSLFDAGFDLVGVSSRPPSRAVEAATYGWVADWLLPLRAVMLGPNAKLEVECDLLIDDDPAALRALSELGEACGILLDRPWNRDADWPRASWEELPSLVTVLADAVVGVPVTERRWELEDALGGFV